MPGISTMDALTGETSSPTTGMPTGWDLPTQPQTTYRGTNPSYYVSPGSYIPSPIGNNPNSPTAFKQIWKNVIPTSTNLRNQQLQRLLAQMQVPLGGALAAGPSDQAAESYGAGQGGLASALASRGLVGSGAEDVGRRQGAMGYVGAMNQAVSSGRQAADQRRMDQIQQILNIPNEDLQFYQAIRSGSIPAGQVVNPPNYGWPMLATGIAQLVKTLASMGAGAVGAGGAAGAASSGGEIASSGAGSYMGMGGVGSALSGLGYAGGGGMAGVAAASPTWMGAGQAYMGGGGYGLGSYLANPGGGGGGIGSYLGGY